MRAEIAEVLGHRPPMPADMPRLADTGMVIEETLRLYPPIGAFGRQAIRDDVIAGYPIPAQSTVRIKPIETHRHPEFWPEPERFVRDDSRPHKRGLAHAVPTFLSAPVPERASRPSSR